MEKEEWTISNMIYMDNAATTRLDEGALEAMLPFFKEDYANPSAIYSFADAAKAAVDDARSKVAKLIGARTDEIYFTAGGSESDNWALKSAVLDIEVNKAKTEFSIKSKHIITTKIEHHAILHTANFLEKMGYAVTYLDVDEKGQIDLDELRAAIRPETVLISVMAANNEIGTIMPIGEIGKIAHENGIIFHTDAVQAFGHIPIDVDEMNIDMLSASGHKLGGPKGVGILYIRQGVRVGSYIHGGAQERQRRAGTLNVPGIVGMGYASEKARTNLQENISYCTALRDHLIRKILTEIPDTRLNGDEKMRLPNNVNVSFPGIEGESLLISLDMMGICASAGSACTSGSIEASHVLTAIGLEGRAARASLRLTISPENTYEEADFVVEKLKEIVERLRRMSAGK